MSLIYTSIAGGRVLVNHMKYKRRNRRNRRMKSCMMLWWWCVECLRSANDVDSLQCLWRTTIIKNNKKNKRNDLCPVHIHMPPWCLYKFWINVQNIIPSSLGGSYVLFCWNKTQLVSIERRATMNGGVVSVIPDWDSLYTMTKLVTPQWTAHSLRCISS